MIMGTCPYDECSGAVFIPIAERTPAFERHACEECGRPIWTHHSRVNPWSMTESDFLLSYAVDEESRRVTPLAPEPQPTAEHRAAVDAFARSLVDMMIHGNSTKKQPRGILNCHGGL